MLPEHKDWDQAIRQGRAEQIKVLLKAFVRDGRAKRMSSQDRALHASLFRRCGLFDESARFLFPFVRFEGRLSVIPAEEELVEYGAALVQMGAEREGFRILQQLAPSSVPQTLLFQAFALFSRWDYRRAIPLLRQYDRTFDGFSYERAVAQVNLCAALAFEGKFADMEKIAESLADFLKREKSWLLYGSLLGIQAQGCVQEKDWAGAKNCLKEAEKLVSDKNSLNHLYIQKWKVVGDLHRGGLTPSVGRRLEKIRARARQLLHFETLRNCDFHVALKCQDEEMVHKLYFGTPYSHYRKHLLDKLSVRPRFGESYTWRPRGGKCEAWVDTLTGENTFSSSKLKPNQNLQRLLEILSSDFYRPHTIPSLYQAMFPDRHFHPHSSPGVIHQSIKRLRLWAQTSAIPICIESTPRGYRLGSKEKMAFKVYDWNRIRGETKDNELATFVHKTRVHFHNNSFSRKAVSEVFQLKDRTANALIQRAVQQNLVLKKGAGPSTYYILTALD